MEPSGSPAREPAPVQPMRHLRAIAAAAPMRLYSWATTTGCVGPAPADRDLVRHDRAETASTVAAEPWRLEARAGPSRPSGLPAQPAVAGPGKIVCVGLNYRAHVTEGAGRDVPDRPLLFSKFANAVVADGEADRPPGGLPRPRPRGRARRRHRQAGAARPVEAEAMDHVAGYVVVNDVSARDWQGSPPALREGEKGDGQWLRAKGSDTFLPMGPVFVTTDELDPAPGSPPLLADRPGGDARLMQDGTTADMIFGVPELIAFITAADHASSPATSSRPARRRASASSATRRSSSSRATASAARSRGSARSRTRSRLVDDPRDG